MMLNRKYLEFSIVILLTFLSLEGCTDYATTSDEDSEQKAFEVARTACGLGHSKEMEPPREMEATLTTFDEAKKMLGDDLDVHRPSWISGDSQVWLVRLSGRWQLVGGPPLEIETTVTPNLPAPTPELWDLCEVLIDPNMDMHSFYIHEGWKEASP